MSDAREANYQFDCATLSGVPPLRRVHLVEALNEPYALRVDCVLDDPTLEVADLLGQDCSVQIYRGSDLPRRVCGVIRDVREADVGGEPTTRLMIVPALQLLSQRRDTRIFQNMSVPDILAEVLGALGDYGRDVQQQLDASYPTREYCVQYQETDLDFAHRLMEEEGISYAFTHEGDVEVMVLRDRNGSFTELPSGSVVEYQPHNRELGDAEPICHFERFHRPTTTKTVVRDWDWTRGGDMRVEAEDGGADRDGKERERYEHGRGRSLSIWSYDQGATRYQSDDSSEQAVTRQLAHQHEQIVGEAVSRVIAAAPGHTFELIGHPTVGLDGAYVITRVEHVSESVSSALPELDANDAYHNRIECIPLDTEYRPHRRTRKPYIPSIQTAVVTGPGGEEIHVDEHGRIKIQFHWDRVGQYDENSSCWVRVQQPWAGAGWGFWWVPRIGMEVVVHFVDGDPDRPVVTASVYDGANPTPYALPDDKTKSTIKSNTSLGGGGFNEFRFEDKAGSEEIYTHAQKDYNEVVENDHTTWVHHDQTNTVDNDQTQTVHNNQTEQVDGNQQMTVDGNRTVHVKTNFDETVDGTETRHTVGDVTESFDANEARTISGSVTESITGDETRSITGSQTETVTGGGSQTVGGATDITVTGSRSETITGGITHTTPASYDITAVGGMSITAAAGITMIAPGGATVIAPGGVTKVDSYFKWAGLKKTEVGVTCTEAFAFKIGITAVSMGYTAVKYEDVGVATCNKGADFTQVATSLKSAGTSIKNGAIWLKTKAAVIKAG